MFPWPGESEVTFRFLSQAATCPPGYHTQRGLHTVFFNAKHQAGKPTVTSFTVFGLTRLGIEIRFFVSVINAEPARPLTDKNEVLWG